MNIRRFTARTSRDALALVRQALGDDAVVLSTKPCAEGVEVLAMAPEGMQQIERMAAAGRAAAAAPARDDAAARPAPRGRGNAAMPAGVDDDVAQLSMSTLSFQDYVRERMLRRRQAALDGKPDALGAGRDEPPRPSRRARAACSRSACRRAGRRAAAARAARAARAPMPPRRVARPHVACRAAPSHAGPTARCWPTPTPACARREQHDMLSELRSMKGLIEDRFGALAFMEKLQRQPAPGAADAEAARLRLLAGADPQAGRGPAVRRRPTRPPGPPACSSATCSPARPRAALEDQGGVYALIGSTGVGKTTTHRQDRRRLRDAPRRRATSA